jgi:8-oxo-dGTP diphosphatase
MSATLVDRGFQLFYRGAFKLMRTYWAVRKPNTHGALVAIWHDGKVLLVRQSYLDYYSVPGGYLKRGETGKQAAIRELSEEIGLRVREDQLRLAFDVKQFWQGRDDHVEMFELDVDAPPKIDIDNREVVGAAFYTPQEALKLDLFPPLRRLIEERLKRH